MSSQETVRTLRCAVGVLGLFGALGVLPGSAHAKPAGPARTPRAAASGPATAETDKALRSDERRARFERYQKWAKDWRARRDIHRKARLKRLRYRLDRVLEGAPVSEAVRAELTSHAQRLARLYRIKELAIEKEDDESIARVDGLIRRESSRHERWLARQQEAARP